MANDHEEFKLQFQEQIDFLKQKIRIPTLTYRDLASRQHDRAFVVAGALKADLLNDLHNAVIKAVAEGQSFKQFQNGFDDVLGKHGWLNGTDKEYRAWRAKVIYQTNMRTSHAAGRYRQMTDPEVLKRRPYWRYRHNTIENPRIQHERWNNLVLPADSQFWKVNFPPNGYGCNCTVEAINDRQLKAMGKTKPDQEPAFDSIRDGFDSSPGASWYPDLDKYPEQIASAYVDENMKDGVFDRWMLRIAAQVEDEAAKPEFKDLTQSQAAKKLNLLDQGEQYPVAVLSQAFKKLLDVKSQVVLLKEADAIKQTFLGKSNDIKAVQKLFSSATQSIYKQADEYIVFVLENDKHYVATVQQTSKGLFLKSYELVPSWKERLSKLSAKATLIYEGDVDA